MAGTRSASSERGGGGGEEAFCRAVGACTRLLHNKEVPLHFGAICFDFIFNAAPSVSSSLTCSYELNH